jgi:hypothetical protein
MYEEGKGVRKSNTKALKYYSKACDLELRGPGEILGTQQTGIANMKIANNVY